MDVSSLAGRAAARIRPITGRPWLLPPSSPAPPWASLAVRLPGEGPGEGTGFPRSADEPNGSRRSHPYAGSRGVCALVTLEHRVRSPYRLVHASQHLWHACVSRRCSGSHVLTIRSNPGALPPRCWQRCGDLAIRRFWRLIHGLRCPGSFIPLDHHAVGCTTHAAGGPHVPVGYRWQNTGLHPPFMRGATAPSATSCRSQRSQ